MNRAAEKPHEIVVVDDEASICELLRRGLNEDNFSVTALTRPEETVNAVIERKPCLVILDLHMPGGQSGLKLLKEVKEAAPSVPVVMISGAAQEADKAEARRLGACEFLNKPLNWGYLRNIAYLSLFLKESKSEGA